MTTTLSFLKDLRMLYIKIQMESVSYYLKYEIFDDFSSKQVRLVFLFELFQLKQITYHIFVFYFNRKVLLKILKSILTINQLPIY